MIQKITITLAALIRGVIFGPARLIPQNPRRIVVAQMGRLGDMVCTTPIFRALKDRYPECEVLVVGMPGNAGVLADHPDVNQYYPYSGNAWQLVRILRTMNADAAILCGPHGLVLAVMLAAGIPAVITPEVVGGHSPYETRIYKFLRRFAVTKPHDMLKYAPREYLNLLEPFGIQTDDTRKELAYSSSARQYVQTKAIEAGITLGTDICIGITPTAGNKIKEWPAERFGKLASMIAKEYGTKIVVLGSQNDHARVKEMLTAVDSGVKIWNTCGQMDLDQLKALIDNLDCVIAVDTGPIYIAEAFGVPTIDIVGPMDENGQPPRGSKHIIVKADVPGYPFLRIMNARIYDPIGARQAVEAITPEMVLEKSRELLNDLKNK
ncbi:MAG: glycosyltransferase family 9 protein [Patescibacteria group bacterium]|mgnify:CR=1 FL=1